VCNRLIGSNALAYAGHGWCGDRCPFPGDCFREVRRQARPFAKSAARGTKEKTLDSAHDQQLARLLIQAQDGDQAAYERFLREASVVLRAFLSKRMAAASDRVEDVLQDTLLTVHRARHSFLLGRPIGPWLYAICEHRLVEFFRRYRRIERNEISSGLQAIDAADEPVQQQDEGLGTLVYEALMKLPHRQRVIIEFLKLQDLSVRDVAMQTGMSESAVKVTAFRGYEAIRKMLGRKRK
jgi:RNA polymerase sigma-70 factor, ECF subfamily